MTKGEDRVRVKFNPSGSGVADAIKQGTAALIDLCQELKLNPPDEITNLGAAEYFRLIDLAQTAFEEAAMWAVKAATTGRPVRP